MQRLVHEPRFAVLASGDVFHLHDDVRTIAVGVIDHRSRDESPDVPGIPTSEATFRAEARQVAGDDLSEQHVERVQVVGEHGVTDTDRQQLRFEITDHLTQGRVDFDKPPVKRDQCHPDRGRIEAPLEPGIGLHHRVMGESQGDPLVLPFDGVGCGALQGASIEFALHEEILGPELDGDLADGRLV